MGPCIVNIFLYISNKMQFCTVYLCLKTGLHVSGGTSTHHQERIQLYLQHLVEHIGQLSDINKLCKFASCWICKGICFQCIRRSNLVYLHCMFECFPAVQVHFDPVFRRWHKVKLGQIAEVSEILIVFGLLFDLLSMFNSTPLSRNGESQPSMPRVSHGTNLLYV